MSAAAVLSAVIARIQEFLLEDGAPATIGNEFKERLRALVPYLREVEPLLEGRHKDFAKEVIQLAYDIEDAVECEALLEQVPKGRTKYNGCLGNSKTSLGRIKKCVDGLIKLYPMSSSSKSFSPRGPGEYDDTVGLEDDLEVLTHRLKSYDYSLSKTAIIGMAGVGKTVLAMKLFDHPSLKSDFDICLWASVTQESDAITVIRSILQNHSFKHVHDPGELIKEFYQTLNGKRYLVILDDIWSVEIWDKIQPYFPDSNMRSRVVITSRDERVAHRFKSHEGHVGHVYRLPFLTNMESDELLEKKLRLHHSDMNKNALLRCTMNTIISMCQGLPSEIIRIVDILKKTELEMWETVVHNLLKSEIGQTSLLESIGLSYDYLQPHLKPCFLSLGQFPSDQPIPAEKLHLMWKAERFTVLRDTAESYLNELGDRNLVLVTRKKVLTEELVSYQLQLMTRKLCILKGKEEGFVGIIDSQHGSTSAHRAAKYLNGNATEHDILSNIKDSRALLFFSDNGSRLLSQWSGNFSEFKRFGRTRVLDFDGIDFRANKQSTSKGNLLHLRYLSFARCYLEEFPFSFWTFPFLETLDLRVRTKMVIPNVLWKMSNLRHLYFPVAYECKTREKLKLNGAKKLEVIENFHAGICDVDDLLELGHLQSLMIISDGENIELKKLIKNVQEISDSHSPMKSSLVLNDFDCYSSDREETLKKLFECTGIQILYLEGCIGKMPQNLIIAQNFTSIVLDGIECRQDPMLMLGYIGSLKSLVLINDAICVEEISCRENSFPVLKSLEMNNLQCLKLWELECGSMPALVFLTIKHCNNLVTLPEILMFTVSQIHIGSMPQEFKEKVEELVREIHRFETISISVIYGS